MSYEQKCIERKIRNLTHELEYYKRVYPRCSKIKMIQEKLNMYMKKARSM